MGNNRGFGILIVIFLLQFLSILYISLSYELTAMTGTAYQFKIEGYDPIDPLRGRYLAYMINTDTVKNNLGDYTGKCYLTIEKDEEGFAYLDEAFTKKPEGKDYIEARRYGDNYFETPFTRYFINEESADKAERLFRENSGKAYIVVKVNKGKSIAEGLYIAGERVS